MSFQNVIKLYDKDFVIETCRLVNQRAFVVAQNMLNPSEKVQFITTKGFDWFLVKDVDGHIKAKFNPNKFNPYTCAKEESLYSEYQLISRTLERNEFYSITDFGYSEFNGNYKLHTLTGYYEPNIYFESIPFELDFDLYRYQNDDFYNITHSSATKDSYPVLVDKYGTSFDNVYIIHGVDRNGVEYVDNHILNLFLSDVVGDFTNAFNLYRIRFHKKNLFTFEQSFPFFKLLKLQDVKQYEDDCGNNMIKSEMRSNGNFSKRKYCYRRLWEYFYILNKNIKASRKKTPNINIGPREFKKEEFKIIFENDSMKFFKVLYLQNILTLDKRTGINRYVSGDPIFLLSGEYDYANGSFLINQNTQNSASATIRQIKQYLGVNPSVKLGQLFSIWGGEYSGYTPKHIELPMAQKANSQPFTNKLVLYDIPRAEDPSESDFETSQVFVNLKSLLENFGIHHSSVRAMIIMDTFDEIVLRDFGKSLLTYELCRDIRRKLFDIDATTPLSRIMIPLYQAIELIEFFEQTGKEKNSFWYSNANYLLQAFPDTPTDFNYYYQYTAPTFSSYIEDNNLKGE